MNAPPPGWGTDPISQYLDVARANTYAHFANWKQEYSLLLTIDGLFREALASGPRAEQVVAATFMLRSHAAYLVATMLALAGAVSDLPMVLRGSLESALYGLHADRSPTVAEIWLRRMDSDESRRTARREFSPERLWQTLREADLNLCASAQAAYEQVIEYGAHPNIGAFGTTLELKPSEQQTELVHTSLAADPVSRVACLSMTTDIGLCDLRILAATFAARFGELGIPARIADAQATRVRVGINRLRNEGLLSPNPEPPGQVPL